MKRESDEMKVKYEKLELECQSLKEEKKAQIVEVNKYKKEVKSLTNDNEIIKKELTKEKRKNSNIVITAEPNIDIVKMKIQATDIMKDNLLGNEEKFDSTIFIEKITFSSLKLSLFEIINCFLDALILVKSSFIKILSILEILHKIFDKNTRFSNLETKLLINRIINYSSNYLFELDVAR